MRKHCLEPLALTMHCMPCLEPLALTWPAKLPASCRGLVQGGRFMAYALLHVSTCYLALRSAGAVALQVSRLPTSIFSAERS